MGEGWGGGGSVGNGGEDVRRGEPSGRRGGWHRPWSGGKLASGIWLWSSLLVCQDSKWKQMSRRWWRQRKLGKAACLVSALIRYLVYSNPLEVPGILKFVREYILFQFGSNYTLPLCSPDSILPAEGGIK